MTPAREASQSLQRHPLPAIRARGALRFRHPNRATREGRSLRWRQIRARGVRIHLTQEAQAQDPWGRATQEARKREEHPWQLARILEPFPEVRKQADQRQQAQGPALGPQVMPRGQVEKVPTLAQAQVHQQWSLRMEGSRVLETSAHWIGEMQLWARSQRNSP